MSTINQVCEKGKKQVNTAQSTNATHLDLSSAYCLIDEHYIRSDAESF